MTTHMHMIIQMVENDAIEELIPVLKQAEASEAALRWSLAHLSDTIYRADVREQLVGAATMRWHKEPCELVELAIATGWQGQGLGKQLVAWLLDEARLRGKRQMLVGTANSSINNIAFYQKCGFRMDHVREDYFWYYRKPEFENGIQIRDMLVFRFDLTPAQSRKSKR